MSEKKEKDQTMNDTNSAASKCTVDEFADAIIEYLRKEHITIGRSKRIMEAVICKIRKIEEDISL